MRGEAASSWCRAQEKRSARPVGPTSFLFLPLDCLYGLAHNTRSRIQQECSDPNHRSPSGADPTLKSQTGFSSFQTLFLSLSGQWGARPCFTGVLQRVINDERFEDEKHLLRVFRTTFRATPDRSEKIHSFPKGACSDPRVIVIILGALKATVRTQTYVLVPRLKLSLKKYFSLNISGLVV